MKEPFSADFEEERPIAVDQSSCDAAESLLTEAVYQSRAKQASAAGLTGTDLTGEVGPGSCGLGLRALVELEQSDKGRAAFAILFPSPSAAEANEALAALLTSWVELQDKLDRKRNHFMRDFRDAHGYDRRQYNETQRTTFEAGVDAINGEENSHRHQTALKLVALSKQSQTQP